MAFVGSAIGVPLAGSTKATKRTGTRGRRTVTAVLWGGEVMLSQVNWTAPRGEGSFGAVFFGVDEKTGMKIVVKCPKDVPLARNLADTEKYMNRKLMNVSGRWAEYLGDFPVPYDAMVPKGTLKTCLVWKMEGDGSTLEDYLERQPVARLSHMFNAFENTNSKINLKTCQAVMRELLCGVIEMQDKGIMHRDVKPANIICSPGSMYPLKIIDFGSACDWKTPLKKGLRTDTCDPVYAAPEKRISLLAPDKFDVFSLGLIAMQILLPSLRETWQIADFRYRLECCNFNLVHWCREMAAHGSSGAMVAEAAELLEHEEQLYVIAQMLRADPFKRASAGGALLSGAFGEVAFADE